MLKKHLFLTTTALLAMTPAIIVQADTFSPTTTPPSEQPTVTAAYLDEFSSDTSSQQLDDRTAFQARIVHYHVNSITELHNAFYAGLSNYNTSIMVTSNGFMTGNSMAAEYNRYRKLLLDIDDYLARQMKNIQFVTNGNTLTVNIEYYSDYAEQQYITARVKEIAAEIFSPGMSEFQKVKAVNDYVVKNTVYNKLTNSSPYGVYAILTEGEGVCQAYALLALRLYQEAGIAAHFVMGDTTRGLHAWNLVRIDGQWYHVDSTWNDPTMKVGNQVDEDYISYEYFLLSDTQIVADHSLDYPTGTLPKATSTKYSPLHSVTKPIQIGDILLYGNRNDSSRLYLMDLSAHTPAAQKISDTRYMNMLYANDSIYFSNYSVGGYLYKLDLELMEEIPLVNERVGQILNVGEYVVAYNLEGRELYREEIYTASDYETVYEEPTAEPTLSQNELTSIQQRINRLDPNAESFIEAVTDIANALEEANESDLAAISNYDTYVDYYNLAIEYATLIDTINEYIFILDLNTDPYTLVEYLEGLSQLLDAATPAVMANIDGLGLLSFVEQYLEELEYYEGMPTVELVAAILELVDDTEYMHRDFYQNTTQLYKMLFGLDDAGYDLISAPYYEKINEMLELLDQMRAMTFTNSTEIQEAPKTTNVGKVWTVTMSGDLLNTAENRNRVIVLDMFGNKVDVAVTFTKNKMLITPKYNYIKEIPYTLVLQKGLQSAAGKALKADYHMHFTIQ